MSQAGDISAVSGPVPQNVLTSITTDLSESLPAYPAGAGTTTPVNNNVRMKGDMGIVTVSDPAQPEFELIRFNLGETQTTDANPKIIKSFTMVDNTCLSFHVLISAYSTDNLAIGGNTIATFKNVAGTASVIDQGDLNINADALLNGCVFGVSVTGATINFFVQGLAGKTINWTAIFPGIAST